MKTVGVLLVILGACTGGGVGDDSYPVTPPGVGGQGTSTGGGGGGGGSGNVLLTAKICILTDSTKLDSCDTTAGAGGGYKVTLRAAVAAETKDLGATPASGFVTTTPPANGATYWIVTNQSPAVGKVIFSSLVAYDGPASKSPGGQTIPVFLEEDYIQLSQAHAPLGVEDDGAIIVHVVDADKKTVTGAVATLDPISDHSTTWYAATTLDTWDENSATGTTDRGLIWFPALDIVKNASETISIDKLGPPKLHGERVVAMTSKYVTFVPITVSPVP